MPSKRVNPPALGHGPKGGEPPDDSGRGQIWQIGRATVRLFLAAVLFLITVLHTTEAYGHGAELISAGSSSWSFIAQLAVEGWYYGTHLKHDWAAVYRCRSCVPMIWKMTRRVLRRIWHKLAGR